MKKFSAIVFILIFYLISLSSSTSEAREAPKTGGISQAYDFIGIFTSLTWLTPDSKAPIKWRGVPYRITCSNEIVQTQFSLKGKTFIRTTLNEDIIYDMYKFNDDMTFTRKTLYSNSSKLFKKGIYIAADCEIVFIETNSNFKKNKITFIFEWVNDHEFNLYRGKESDNYILEKVL